MLAAAVLAAAVSLGLPAGDEAAAPRGAAFHTLSFHVGKRADDVAAHGEHPDAKCRKSGTCDGPGTWHSQAHQDTIVFNALLPQKKNGYFVDLAANHPIQKSNTRALERDHGWRGLCIDGNEEFLLQLVQRRKCTVVGAIVSSDDDGDVMYRHWHGAYQDAHGGTSGTWHHALSGIVGFDNSQGGNDTMAKVHGQAGMKSGFVDKKGVSVRLEHLLRTHGAPQVIDYLSLDVEGAEWSVLRDFPFGEFTFLALTIERPNADLMALLEKNRYVFFGEVGNFGERIFAHESLPGGIGAAKTRYEEEVRRFGHKAHKG